MYRTEFWTLWERVRVGWFGRMALKHVYYHMCKGLPVQVQSMRQGAQGWCTGMTQRNGMGREVGEGSGWGTHIHLCWIHVDVWQNHYNIKINKFILKKIKTKKPPEDLLDPEIKTGSPELQAESLLSKPPGEVHAYDTTLMAESEEELKSSWWKKVYGEGNDNPLPLLAWKIPGTEEPGRLQSMELQRVRHDWVTSWWRWKRRVKKLAWNSTFKKLRSWHPVSSLHGK